MKTKCLPYILRRWSDGSQRVPKDGDVQKQSRRLHPISVPDVAEVIKPKAMIVKNQQHSVEQERSSGWEYHEACWTWTGAFYV